MNRYKSAVLIVILALLGGYTYFWETKKPKTGQAAGNAQKIFNINSNDAGEIALRMRGLSFLLKKEGGQWKIEKPHQVNISKKRVDDLLSIFDYGIVRVVDKGPSDYAQYGLDRPEVEIGVRIGGLSKFQTLLIGNNNPTDTCSYAGVKGRPEVLLVGTSYGREIEEAISYLLSKK